MTSDCSNYKDRIPRSFVGDLTAEEHKALELHLAACPSCRQEEESYAETLRMLQSVDDDPVPRHFFVYPQERASNPWQIFRQMKPLWQGAAAGFAALVMLLGAASASQVRIRSDHGVWTLSLGRGTASDTDVAVLKADILRTVEERNRQVNLAWVEALRSEILQSRTDLGQQQQVQLANALASLESRLNSRIVLTADDLRAGTQKSLLSVYQALAQQRAQDLNTISARLDMDAANSEIKANQTDAILGTLIQVANLTFKQTGDQK